MSESIKTWAEQDRPREKLLKKGAESLSNSELIAILLASGNVKMSAVELARHILKRYDNKLSQLSRCTADELKQFQGVGDAKAVTLLAALELGRRRKIEKAEKPQSLSSSMSAYELLSPMMEDRLNEEFWILYLDRANHVIDKLRLSQGGTAATIMDVKIIIKIALEKLAHGIILSHNHPSGSLKPSRADILVTEKIQKATKLFDIKLLDHLIITNNDYFSFNDENMLIDKDSNE
ncbi:MAG: DNA repair protein RadC [Bacteroidota bacterium]|nr:DNA repair protein RadC [Bacteroidota bacterium]